MHILDMLSGKNGPDMTEKAGNGALASKDTGSSKCEWRRPRRRFYNRDCNAIQ
jgi:hypothetical protein